VGGHVVRTGDMENAYNPMGRDHLEDLGVYCKIILEWMLRK